MQLSVRQVDRLAAIVSDLLDINRINQGRLEYNFKSVPIGPAVAEVVERMSVSFPDHRIVLKLQNLTARAKLDELRFEQVLTNLITNAVKYSPKDTDTEIFMYAQDGRIMIEIKDRGMGIAPEDQKYIFDRYYRTQDAIKSKASGMGVGLFIADQIIKAHGGKLSVHSNVGQGSTFIIELPRDDARGDHDARDSGTRDGDVRDGGAPSGAGSAPDDMPGDLPGGVPDDTSGDTSGGVSDKALGGISGGLSGGAGGGG
jgi:signal transduction histidine kinase